MVTKRVRCSVALSAPLMLLAVAACTGGGESDETEGQDPAEVFQVVDEDADDVCEEGREGGSLTYRLTNEGAGFDPAVQSANLQLAQAVFGTLVQWDNLTDSYEGYLAESISGNDDSTVWTLKLRPEGEFPDGTPLDSAAVKRSIERFVHPDFPSTYTQRVAEIDTIETPDPLTVVFTLHEPWGTFPWTLAMAPGMIVNPTVLDSTSPEELQSSPPEAAGAGAFTFDNYARGASATVNGKSDWWAGPVCLEQLTVNFGTNDAVADYDLMRSGQAQAMLTWEAQLLRTTIADESVKRYQVPGADILTPIIFNHREPPGDDVRIRKAMQLAMDRDLISERNFEGLVYPEGGVVSPSGPFQPTVEPLGYDKEAAAELVEEAVADGVDPSFTYILSGTTNNENLAILQQSLASEVGLDMETETMQSTEWVERVNVNRTFDAAQGGGTPHPSCVYCAYDPFLSTNDAGNYSGTDSEAVDEALDVLKAASTPEETVEGLDALQTVWNEEAPQVQTLWMPQYLVVASNVHGVRFTSAATPVLWDQVYIDE